LFRFLFILHTAHAVDTCALPSIMLSLSLTDMMYCTPEKKPTLASAPNFRLVWISLLHTVVKCVRNRTVQFHCVFGSTGGYGV